MKGIQHIEISTRNIKYKFDLARNITIVKGDSGSGKTTLYNMVRDFTRLGNASGIVLSCKKKCVALVDLDWKNQLREIKDSIVFIDEGSPYVASEDFAKAIKKTDNYYVIFNRDNLHQLPYSAEEIYQIKNSGKFHLFEKLYKSKPNHDFSVAHGRTPFKFDTIFLEDSKAGLQFYQAYFDGTKIQCKSAGSKSKIYNEVKNYSEKNPDKKILIIADGASFGSEMNRVMELQSRKSDVIRIILPESFEWLVLKSGILRQNEIKKILENPSDYIDSKDFFSWEQFFVFFLIERTKSKSYAKYSKSKLAEFYKKKENAEQILKEIR